MCLWWTWWHRCWRRHLLLVKLSWLESILCCPSFCFGLQRPNALFANLTKWNTYFKGAYVLRKLPKLNKTMKAFSLNARAWVLSKNYVSYSYVFQNLGTSFMFLNNILNFKIHYEIVFWHAIKIHLGNFWIPKIWIFRSTA